MPEKRFISTKGKAVTVTKGWECIFTDEYMSKLNYNLLDYTKENKDGDPNKILIERNCGGLGDILMIQAAIKQLVENNRDKKYTVSFPGQYAWMFRDIDVNFIDCYLFCSNYLENIREFRFKINMQCPYIDYKNRINWRPKKNRIEVFAEHLGVTPKAPTLKRNKDHEDPRFKDENGIGLVLEVADRIRPYPLDRWVKLAYKLKELGFRPVTISQRKVMDGIDSVTGISMEKLVTIIDQMKIIVTADTGPLHIAAALGKKTIGLFGPTNGALICKMYPTVKVIQKLKGPTPCYRPCYSNSANNFYCKGVKYAICMQEISVEEIIDAIVKES